ncbi:serine/threonine-protein kinase TBK1 isoform X2 [Hydra vulgaris]|uniref:Serine/threonine-protein kinase TBK1 isoform X2 n=1 Tax=Hydra vulgaris TaxID=6087 RepID=A0ABM4DIH9_HYDVU
MNAVRQSLNYVWSVQEVIGNGATGTVYKCSAKKTGAPCAAKVFNSQADRRPYEVRIREIELLQKLSHPNIIKLMGLEQEIGSKATVLVMELCGSSLHEIIEEPENMFGLDDTTLMHIIQDVCAGMEYLKNSNVVHRDVKPGNILRADKGSGGYIYKITDFGAARELGEAEQFVSVYGTEEYLHPDIYEKAVMKWSSNKTFTSRVDMWSLGVTFYHLATGQLPFRPAGGRQNKDIMFKMISEKSNDAISCYQDLENGSLIYSNKLPRKTRISENLKMHLTPILKCLLQIQQKFMLSYEDFFKAIKELVSLKKIDVFCCGNFTLQSLYMDASEITATNLFQTLGITNGDIIFNEDLIDISTLPSYETTVDNPFIILTSSMSCEKLLNEDLPQNFNTDDLKLSKMHAGYAYDFKRKAENIILCCKLTKQIYRIVQRSFLEDFKLFQEIYTQKHYQTEFIKNQFIRFKKLSNLKDNCNSDIEIKIESQQKYGCVVSCLSEIQALLKRILENMPLKMPTILNGSEPLLCLESINFLVKLNMSIFQKFYKDKYCKRAVATMLDELVHKTDKEKLQINLSSLKEKLEWLNAYQVSLKRDVIQWLSYFHEEKQKISALTTKLDQTFKLLNNHFEQESINFDDEMSKYIFWSRNLIDFNKLQKQLELLENIMPELIVTANEQQQKLEYLENFDMMPSD